VVPFYRTSKFWLAVVSALLIVANEGLGLNIPTDVVMAFAALIISYILGDSVVTAAHITTQGRIEEARMNNAASLERTQVLCSGGNLEAIKAASRQYAAIETEADKKL